MIKSGYPSIVAAETAEGIADVFADVVTPQPLTATLGELARACLDKFAGNAVVIVDPNSGKVIGADGVVAAQILVPVANDYTTVVADPGQTGLSLTFSIDEQSGEPTATEIALTALMTTAVKPKRSIESLIAAALAKCAELEVADGQLPLIVIDQANAAIRFTAGAAAKIAAVEAIAPVQNRVQLKLTPPAAPAEASAQVFEGGPTPL